MSRAKNRRHYFSAVLLLTSLLSSVGAQQSKPQTKPFELTVDSIMRGPRLVGYSPSGVY
jgi:hypothetical protein